MGKKKRSQVLHTADTGAVDGVRGFAGIPQCVLKSAAYRHLSLIARAILVELVSRMNGHNNGQVSASYAEFAACLNRKNQAPIGPAIAELMQHGLIDLSADSVWRERKAREYRLTFVCTSDSIGRPIKATNDYLKWKPKEKNGTTDVVAVKRKSATAFVSGKAGSATNGVAGANGKLPKTSECAATDGVIPICKPYADARSEAANPLKSPLVSAPDRPPEEAALALRGKITGFFFRELTTAKRRRAWAESFGVTHDQVERYCILDLRLLPAAKAAAMVRAIENVNAGDRADWIDRRHMCREASERAHDGQEEIGSAR